MMGVGKSGGKIGNKDGIQYYGLAEPRYDWKVKASVKKGGCLCCIDDIEFKFATQIYLPNVGDTVWVTKKVEKELPSGQTEWSYEVSPVSITKNMLDALTQHENLHAWAGMKGAFAFFPKAESQCKGACWKAKKGGVFTQKACDELADDKAYEVVQYVDDYLKKSMGVTLHQYEDSLGLTALGGKMMSGDDVTAYQSTMKKQLAADAKTKTFCGAEKGNQ